MRSSARKTSCSRSNWRRLSKLLYRSCSFFSPITRVMRLDSAVANEACAMASLNALCGSAVMRQIVVVGAEWRECGTGILPGFSRFLSTMCFFVVRVSQIGSSPPGELPSSDASSVFARRFFVVDSLSLRFDSELMCLRRAVEALKVYLCN